MSSNDLAAIATNLVATGRGLLAMDESTSTCNARFAAAGIPQTEDARRAYRELIVTTPDLGTCISGAILFDETIRQRTENGTLFVDVLKAANITPGIKVDLGAHNMALHPGEKITEGLDGLRGRLEEYFQMGARFAKWRAVITIGYGIPSRGCLEANANTLARYAALCQETGIVPIVEPEVLMDGAHDLAACEAATTAALQEVFTQLTVQNVLLEGMILKPNMVLPGLACAQQDPVAVVAAATLRTLRRCVPAAVAGIAFLSGGQTGELATARLNEMHLQGTLPWPLLFSYSRAVQTPALEIWHGAPDQVGAAQKALYHRAWCNRAALSGSYTPAMEQGVQTGAAA